MEQKQTSADDKLLRKRKLEEIKVDNCDPRTITMELLTESQKQTMLTLGHQCPICLSILQEPVETECGHTACKECAYRCFFKDNTIPCWICRKPVYRENIRKTLALSNQINNLDEYKTSCVDCNKMNLCISYAMAHFKDKCAKHSKFICSCDNIARSMQEHQMHNREHSSEVFHIYDEVYIEHKEMQESWDLRLAIHNFSSNNTKVSVELLKKNVENTYAATLLGHCYAMGIGVIKNVSTAVELYEMAASRRHPRAMYHLAALYGRGSNPDNKSKILNLLFESAWLGDSFSQYSLGLIHEKGLWVEKNINVAIDYFEQSSKKNNIHAIKKMIDYYKKEDGTGPLSHIPVEQRTKNLEMYMRDNRIQTFLNDTRGNLPLTNVIV